jgi:hypothetical protein
VSRLHGTGRVPLKPRVALERALPRGARVMLGERGTRHPVPSASIQSTARTLACVRGEKERHACVRQGGMEEAKGEECVCACVCVCVRVCVCVCGEREREREGERGREREREREVAVHQSKRRAPSPAKSRGNHGFSSHLTTSRASRAVSLRPVLASLNSAPISVNASSAAERIFARVDSLLAVSDATEMPDATVSTASAALETPAPAAEAALAPPAALATSKSRPRTCPFTSNSDQSHEEIPTRAGRVLGMKERPRQTTGKVRKY